MDKIILYHLSDIEIKNKLLVNFYGKNYYTSNDKSICNIPRLFLYLNPKDIEYRFKQCKYIYQIKVNKNSLYDLRTDKNGLINRFKYNGFDVIDINKLIKYIIKSGYMGIIYKSGGLNMVNLFNDVKIFKTKIKDK